jgi:hypothetical protein
VIRAVARHGAVTGLWHRSLPENPRPSDGIPSRPARRPLAADMAIQSGQDPAGPVRVPAYELPLLRPQRPGRSQMPAGTAVRGHEQGSGPYVGTMTSVGRRAVLTCLAGTTGHCRPRAVRGLCAPTPVLRGLCAPAPATRLARQPRPSRYVRQSHEHLAVDKWPCVVLKQQAGCQRPVRGGAAASRLPPSTLRHPAIVTARPEVTYRVKTGDFPIPGADSRRQTGLMQQGRHDEATDGEPGRERTWTQ